MGIKLHHTNMSATHKDLTWRLQQTSS